ncbi:hypothetical protein SAMN05661010_03166 [Modicisalibacter muralis]|uniref:Uncharacterized protein n=1 Tax=Modicisalibacter muralis TaxID=119000 RepID=A0A1G9PW13_9GAMM|nr:hypothetical protein [Halomonas muralis]SDM02944.1 hypothetical protein SAMN05661010_03166 [Halomonas muralis]
MYTKNYMASTIGLIALIAAATYGTRPAQAALFESYQAALHAYFYQYRALPIILPTDEEPGDIYLNPYEGFLARKHLCFAGLNPSMSTTVLADAIDTRRYAVSGELRSTLYKVADIGVDANISISDAVELRFTGARVERFTQGIIENALADANPECDKKLQEINERGEEYSYQERVPWVLRDVVSAKFLSRLRFQRDMGAAVEAQANRKFAKMVSDLGGTISGDIESSGNITIAADSAFPVAFRPAFISREDIDRLLAMDDPSLWESLKSAIFGDGAARNELKDIRSKFPDGEIPLLSEMYEQMGLGPSVTFDLENEEHVIYFKRRILLLTMAWELYGEYY